LLLCRAQDDDQAPAEDAFFLSEATIDTPIKSLHNAVLLRMEVQALWFFDRKTGAILLRLRRPCSDDEE
jgi:hypothetical protein